MLKDVDIRKVLINYIQEINKDVNYRIINEMSVCDGDARVDIAVANGHLCGFEIKSDVDKLTRLESQSNSYNKVFDEMYIVTSGKYRETIKQHIPSWWGIIYIKRNLEIKVIKKSKRNKDVQLASWLDLLWREEVLNLLKENDIKGYSNKNRRILRKVAIDTIPSDTIYKYTLNILKSREGWREDAILLN